MRSKLLFNNSNNNNNGKEWQVLVWDATCSDTFAPSFLARATSQAADERKKSKYACLDQCHLFAPVSVETFLAQTHRSFCRSWVSEFVRCLPMLMPIAT